MQPRHLLPAAAALVLPVCLLWELPAAKGYIHAVSSPSQHSPGSLAGLISLPFPEALAPTTRGRLDHGEALAVLHW